MNCIIVHGSNDNEEEGLEYPRENERHWQPWIKKELEKKGINVSNVLYPKDWAPDYEEWKKIFEKNKIDENSILIGHSDGASFLVRWLGETKKKIKKLILVAPWEVSYREGGGDKKFYDYEVDSSIKFNVNEIIIFTADNEIEGRKKNAKTLNKSLGGKLIELKGKGHFTLGDMGTKEFPELLEEVLN